MEENVQLMVLKDEDIDLDNIDINHLEDGFIDTPVGMIKRIKTILMGKDLLGSWRVRCGIKRNAYKIPPGLYAIGNPDRNSHVLVTANYKLTFDELRKELKGLDLWIMVIDTKGINVWCAAGKGTFGTEEIIYRLKKIKLHEVVDHRNLILPQLGAPGVAAHVITQKTGFKVIYGPIRAKDIPEFLWNECKATKEMRKVTFHFLDRLVVAPVEMILSFKYIAVILFAFLMLNGLTQNNMDFGEILKMSIYNTMPYVGAILIGTFLMPLLLPFIPFRSFALKGFVLGLIWALITVQCNQYFLFADHFLVLLGNGLLLIAIVTYLGLNFTGSTPYTSLSGVQKETLWTFPIVFIGALLGIGMLIADKFI